VLHDQDLNNLFYQSSMFNTPIWSQIALPLSDHVSTRLSSGEVVFLHLPSGEYLSLDGVGAVLWDLVSSGATLTEIRASIVDRYSVEPERCESDLLSLVREMQAAGLIALSGDEDRS
jgi:hypothetical protein